MTRRDRDSGDALAAVLALLGWIPIMRVVVATPTKRPGLWVSLVGFITLFAVALVGCLLWAVTLAWEQDRRFALVLLAIGAVFIVRFVQVMERRL